MGHGDPISDLPLGNERKGGVMREQACARAARGSVLRAAVGDFGRAFVVMAVVLVAGLVPARRVVAMPRRGE